MPAKKPAAKKTTRAKKRGGLTSALGPKVTTALVICVMAGGIAVGARQQQQQMRVKDAAATMAAEHVGDDVALSGSSGPSRAAVSTAITSAAVAPSAKSGAASSSSRAVTVTGCLEKSDEGYRLKDTSGVAAPKSRSWKSGFLKKGSASVDVVDASHTLPLSSEIGHRVSVTGPLTDREMQAQSVRRVATSCKAN